MSHTLTTFIRGICLCLALLTLPACNIGGFFLYAVAGDKATMITVAPRYDGLTDKQIAVIVSIPNESAFHYPKATQRLTQAISSGLANAIEGTQLVRPDDIIAYQKKKPNWITTPNADLIKALKVDRVIHVDLAEYRTQDDSENTRVEARVYRGEIIGKIGVIAADSENPNDYVFLEDVVARYPNTGRIGEINADPKEIESGVVSVFASKVVNLFREHKVPKKR